MRQGAEIPGVPLSHLGGCGNVTPLPFVLLEISQTEQLTRPVSAQPHHLGPFLNELRLSPCVNLLVRLKTTDKQPPRVCVVDEGQADRREMPTGKELLAPPVLIPSKRICRKESKMSRPWRSASRQAPTASGQGDMTFQCPHPRNQC